MRWAVLAGRWVDMWQSVDSEQLWDILLSPTTTMCWDSDAAAALGLVSLLSHATLPALDEDLLDTAGRLLPTVCRSHCKAWQRRQGNETVAWAERPRQQSAHTSVIRGHELHCRLRRREKELQNRAERPDPAPHARDAWQQQWEVDLGHQLGQGFDSHVVSVQMGSRGLQPCLDKLPDLLKPFSHLPMVIHAQDTKLSELCMKSIRDLLKHILPDYTPFFTTRQQKRRGRRYNLAQMSLLRNDVAFSAQRLSLQAILQLDEAGTLTPDELRHCAGRVLVLRTKPPGAKGPVWHVNLYQHTLSASATARCACL
eukprot:2623515-Rhodomonas_salina.2